MVGSEEEMVAEVVVKVEVVVVVANSLGYYKKDTEDKQMHRRLLLYIGHMLG
jgi:hypothetical protein